jgi:hypothetical protein
VRHLLIPNPTFFSHSHTASGSRTNKCELISISSTLGSTTSFHHEPIASKLPGSGTVTQPGTYYPDQRLQGIVRSFYPIKTHYITRIKEYHANSSSKPKNKMIARRSFQAEQVAIEHIDREIRISPKKVEKTYELRGEAQNKNQQMESKSGGEVRGKAKEVTDESQAKDRGEIENESGEKERKGSAQEIIEKAEEKGKKNMMERLKDIVEVRKEEVRRKGVDR